MVIVIDLWSRSRHFLDGSTHAALELIIVVGIEQVVLAVVLIMHYRLDALEAFGESALVIGTGIARAIGISPPGDIGAGKIGTFRPQSLIDQCLEAGTIGAGLRAEDA